MARNIGLSLFAGGKSMIGYDYNGVVDTGQFIPTSEDVIITGNTLPMAKSVLVWLLEHDIYCPVYFMPYLQGANNILITAIWKVEMIQKLNLTKFYEDNATQFEIISKCCPDCEVIKV